MTASTFPPARHRRASTASAESAGLAASRTLAHDEERHHERADGRRRCLLVLVPLVLVFVIVVQKGAGAMSWAFLTKDIPVRARQIGPGMGPAIVGTLIITLRRRR